MGKHHSKWCNVCFWQFISSKQDINLIIADQALATVESPQLLENITGTIKDIIDLPNVDNTADPCQVCSESQITNSVADLASKAHQATT